MTSSQRDTMCPSNNKIRNENFVSVLKVFPIQSFQGVPTTRHVCGTFGDPHGQQSRICLQYPDGGIKHQRLIDLLPHNVNLSSLNGPSTGRLQKTNMFKINLWVSVSLLKKSYYCLRDFSIRRQGTLRFTCCHTILDKILTFSHRALGVPVSLVQIPTRTHTFLRSLQGGQP